MMKRKLLCLGLIACMLAALLPILAVPTAAAKTSEEDYLGLYVTDGLTIWLDAFDSSEANTNLDLENSKWFSRLGDGKYASLKPAEDTPWSRNRAGGISWTQIGTERNQMQTVKSNGIYFDISYLPEKDYTVEIMMSADGVLKENGERFATLYDPAEGGPTIYGNYAGEIFAVGTLRSMTYICLHERADGASTTDQLSNRWYYTGLKYSDHNTSLNSNTADTGRYLDDESAFRNYGVGEAFLLTLQAKFDGDNKIDLSIAYDTNVEVKSTFTGDAFFDGKLPAHSAGYTKDKVADPSRAFFQLAAGMPGTVYGVRVYNRALTDAEQQQNAFADIARYYKLDLTEYLALEADGRAFINRGMMGTGFDLSTREAKDAFASVFEAWNNEADRVAAEKAEREALLAELSGRALDKYNKYYVQKGLVAFLDGFVSMNEWNENIDLANDTWKSTVGDVSARITGTEYWSESKNGKGIGFRLNYKQYNACLSGGVAAMGIEFDPSLLPTQFTIETVAQFVGLTNDDGTRYEDPKGAGRIYGVYTDKYSPFSFGALKTMAFVCNSGEGAGSSLGFRWCYTPKEWGEHNGSEGYANDETIRNMDHNVPQTMTIVKLAPNDAIANVSVYYNNSVHPTLTRSYTAINDRNPEFHLFKGLPSTVYAIRVYDRKLSLEEQAQNHMADILNYYGLDTALLDLVLSNLEDPAELYMMFNTVDFSMTKAEVEEKFRNCLAAGWLNFAGISARLDNKISLRPVFVLNDAAIKAMADSGYEIEVGLLMNLGKTAPTLADAEYRFVLNKNGQGATAFSLGDGKYGVTVRYNCPTPVMSVTKLNMLGYVTLTKDGETIELFLECANEDYDNNMLAVYDYLATMGGYADSAFIAEVVDNSFEEKEILVDAAGGNDEADGVSAAVKTAQRAYEILLELLNQEVPVSVTMKFASGRYILNDKLVLDHEAIEQKYYRLTYLGQEDDSAIITTNVEFENSGWKQVDGRPYYEYQFTADEEGKYPDFRFLYVNGQVQEVAREGFNRTYEAVQAGGYDKMYKVEDYFAGIDKVDGEVTPGSGLKLYLNPVAISRLTDDDIATGKVEFHIPIAWYYRVLHIESVDRQDIDQNGNVAAYFRAGEILQFRGGVHTFKGHYYWLQNAVSFVDEPGEFFYDDTTGKMTYYPAEGVDMATATFEYPTHDHMLSFYGVKNVTLKHLTFTGNDNQAWETGAYGSSQATSTRGDYGDDTKAALYFANTTGVTISECLFHDLPTMGVKFTGVTKSPTVESSRFYGIGSTGIEFGQHSGTWDEKTNANYDITVYNNHLDDIAWYTRGSIGIYVGLSRNTEISYNTVMNTSYTAISIGWRWSPGEWEYGSYWQTDNARIHHNYFRDVMTDQSDGGGIYTLGGNAQTSYHEYVNFMYENYFWYSEKCWDGQGMIMPYYHDGGSSNWHTYSNVLVQDPYRKVHASIYVQNIIEQHVYNVLIEYNEIIAAYKDWETFDGGWDLDPLQQEYAIFGEDGNRRIPDHEQPNYFGHRYYTRIDPDRFHIQQENYNYDHPLDVEGTYVVEMIEATGSEFFKPSYEEMAEIMAPIYDQWYEDLEEAYKNS